MSVSNPVVWRESLHKSSVVHLSALTLVNALAAGGLILFMRERLLMDSGGLLPAWGWFSLAALLVGTACFSYSRLRRERSAGTLELLRSTPLVPQPVLSAHVHMSLSWMAKAVPLWALWLLWISSGGWSAGIRVAILLPIALLVGVAGTLLGIRLALAPQGSGWTALGGGLALATLIGMPACIDWTTACIQGTSRLGGWNGVGDGLILALLCASTAWLWSAARRALSGFELTINRTPTAQVGPLWALFDYGLLAVAGLVGLQKNPFFMRERARGLRRLTRGPGLVLTAVVPALLPLLLVRLFDLTLPAALAWSSIPLIFVWWMAGAEMTRNSMTNELDGRTIDSIRVSPLGIETVLTGVVLGRLYPFAIGWVVSLPVWACYAAQPGVNAWAVGSFALVLLGVGGTAAVGGLRGSCTSLGLKGEERHYSQAVSNPALWAWPAFTALAFLFLVLPLHPLLEATGLVGAHNSWVPMDVITLFPTWFAVPGLLPVPTFLLGVLLHGAVLFSAMRRDLEAAWHAIDRVLCEDLPKAA